jgi:hypothetical protein
MKRKGAGSRPNEMKSSIYIILPTALISGVHPASNRNEYQKQKNNVSGSRARPVRWADRFTIICEPLSRLCRIFNIS